ncbi:hypothetical protein [Pseudonocardia hierapolitana]|nr:hypothetical protein [Pseudonocardia hierapolitana]
MTARSRPSRSLATVLDIALGRNGTELDGDALVVGERGSQVLLW